MEKTMCPRCQGAVGKHSGSHAKRCQTARQWERDHFRDHGEWPQRKQNRRSILLTPGSRSQQRAIAGYKVNAAGK